MVHHHYLHQYQIRDHSSHDYNSISVSKSGDKGDNEKSSDKKQGHDIIQFKTIKHVKSSNVKTVRHGLNDFKNNEFKGDVFELRTSITW